MSIERKSVELPEESWQVVQAALLREALRLAQEGDEDEAFGILAFVAPKIGEAASSPVLSELWGQLWDEMMGEAAA